MLDSQTTADVRADAIARADTLAPETWKATAFDGIKTLCSQKEEITSDDLWELLGDSFMSQVNTSALGPVFVRARKAGLITKTGRFKDSERPVTHGKQNRVWQTHA